MEGLELPGLALGAAGDEETSLLPSLMLLEGRPDLVELEDTNRVTTWIGQVGGVNATSSGADRPTWLPTGGPNGQPAVWFPSSSARMQVASLNPSLTDCYVVGALTVDSNTFQSCLIRQNLPLVCTSSNRTDVASVGGHDGTAWRSVAPATTGAQLLEWVWRSNKLIYPADKRLTLEVLRDGVSLGTAPYAGALDLTGSTSLAVGADIRLSWLGFWGEVPPDQERAILRAQLLARYR